MIAVDQSLTSSGCIDPYLEERLEQLVNEDARECTERALANQREIIARDSKIKVALARHAATGSLFGC